MNVLWGANAPMKVSEVRAVLNERRTDPLAYTTVMTVMSRLAERDALERRPAGRSYSYVPTEADFTALAVWRLIREHGESAVTHFVGQTRADPKLMSRLEQLLAEGPDEASGTTGEG